MGISQNASLVVLLLLLLLYHTQPQLLIALSIIIIIITNDVTISVPCCDSDSKTDGCKSLVGKSRSATNFRRL